MSRFVEGANRSQSVLFPGHPCRTGATVPARRSLIPWPPSFTSTRELWPAHMKSTQMFLAWAEMLLSMRSAIAVERS